MVQQLRVCLTLPQKKGRFVGKGLVRSKNGLAQSVRLATWITTNHFFLLEIRPDATTQRVGFERMQQTHLMRSDTGGGKQGFACIYPRI